MTSLDAPVIIGTGPSGIACAHALIERGIRPVMIDGGNVAGATAQTRQSDLEGAADAAPERDDPSDVSSYAGEKTWFGSSFATDGHPGARVTYDRGVIPRQSHAVGGLSRIWGGTFAFFSELDRWPADTRPDEADLSAVRELVPHSRTDFSDLDQTDSAGVVAGSAASARVMRAFSAAHGDAWYVEQATVAIDTRSGSLSRCQLHGTCLDGCPVDAIWYAGDQLRRWVAEDRVTHISGRVVDSLTEATESVQLVLSDGRASETITTASRVYVAAGGIGTGALLVRSGLRDEVVLRDTATAFAGVLDLRGSSTAERRHHGLAQWWARSGDGGFLAQMYPPDPSNARRLAARLPALSRFPAAVEWFARRLHPVVAYVGTENSDTIRIAMAGAVARVHAPHSAESKRSMRAQLGSFSRALLRAGSLLPVLAAELSTPGAGYHFGASLPHGTETDWLGRLSGLRRIHIVDSSVLPSLELGSITPTVMANAVRIGRQSTEETAAA